MLLLLLWLAAAAGCRPRLAMVFPDAGASDEALVEPAIFPGLRSVDVSQNARAQCLHFDFNQSRNLGSVGSVRIVNPTRKGPNGYFLFTSNTISTALTII